MLGVQAAVIASDWAIPSRYKGKIIAKRVRYFTQKVLALTYDDGPDRKVTPKVLDALKAHNAKATFFVTGYQAQRYPDLMKRIVGEGHVIGIHTYTHASRPDYSKAISEIKRTADIIEKTTGKKTYIFRTPYGIVKNNYTKVALQQGYSVFLWTICSADATRKRIGSATIAKNVIHTPNPGDIVLLHDGPGHMATAIATQQILRELSASGYKFITLPDLLCKWDKYLETTSLSKSGKKLNKIT